MRICVEVTVSESDRFTVCSEVEIFVAIGSNFVITIVVTLSVSISPRVNEYAHVCICDRISVYVSDGSSVRLRYCVRPSIALRIIEQRAHAIRIFVSGSDCECVRVSVWRAHTVLRCNCHGDGTHRDRKCGGVYVSDAHSVSARFSVRSDLSDNLFVANCDGNDDWLSEHVVCCDTHSVHVSALFRDCWCRNGVVKLDGVSEPQRARNGVAEWVPLTAAVCLYVPVIERIFHHG